MAGEDCAEQAKAQNRHNESATTPLDENMNPNLQAELCRGKGSVFKSPEDSDKRNRILLEELGILVVKNAGSSVVTGL
jgi:hypothetical protein